MFSSIRILGGATIGIVLGLSLSLVAWPAGVSAATTPPITFYMQIYGQCLGGSSPPHTTVAVVWRDSTGVLKATGTTATTEYNQWEFCPPDASLAVMPGDKVKVSSVSYARNYVVPNLTIRADRVHQLYLGTGPAGRTIKLSIPNGDYERQHAVRVGWDGTWSFAPASGLGGSYIVDYTGFVSWDSPNSDYLEAYAYYPAVGVTLGKADFYGTTASFVEVSASISGTKHATATATSDGMGNFLGVFRDADGNAVQVAPGDHVSAPSVASNADWIVPNIEASVDKTTEIVSGKCFDTGTAAGYVLVQVVRPGGRERAEFRWSTESDGTFVANFDDYGYFSRERANIKTGDRIKVNCLQMTGDFARLTFVVK